MISQQLRWPKGFIASTGKRKSSNKFRSPFRSVRIWRQAISSPEFGLPFEDYSCRLHVAAVVVLKGWHRRGGGSEG